MQKLYHSTLLVDARITKNDINSIPTEKVPEADFLEFGHHA